jgi:hypothetical protein
MRILSWRSLFVCRPARASALLRRSLFSALRRSSTARLALASASRRASLVSSLSISTGSFIAKW